MNNQVKYIAGLYYFYEKSSQDFVFSLPDFNFKEDTPSDYKSKSKAIYGQVSWAPDTFDQRLEITLGGRFTKDNRAGKSFDKIADIQTGDLSVNSHSFTPAFIVSYKWTEDLHGYAKIVTGYKAGGVSFSTVEYSPIFKPEKLTTYEMGLKSDWLDHHLRLNTDIFYSKYKDMQQIIPTAQFLTGAAFNVGEATISGFDMDILAQLSNDLTLSLNYSYLNAKIDRVPVIAGTIYDGSAPGSVSPYSTGDNIENLFTLPFSSRNSVAFSGDYTFIHSSIGTFAAHLDYRWQSKYYVALNQGPAVNNRDKFGMIGSYGKVNGRLTWSSILSRGESVSASIWGKNLNNERHQSISDVSDNGAIPPTLLGKSVQWSEPRSYGVSIGYEF
jgi:iron complex outermembrane receptor protein